MTTYASKFMLYFYAFWDGNGACMVQGQGLGSLGFSCYAVFLFFVLRNIHLINIFISEGIEQSQVHTIEVLWVLY